MSSLVYGSDIVRGRIFDGKNKKDPSCIVFPEGVHYIKGVVVRDEGKVPHIRDRKMKVRALWLSYVSEGLK